MNAFVEETNVEETKQQPVSRFKETSIKLHKGSPGTIRQQCNELQCTMNNAIVQ